MLSIIIILSGVILTLIVLGYFGYLRFKKSKKEYEELDLKYTKLHKQLKNLYDDGRLGYYEFRSDYEHVYVYVNLIEEYANGMCKVALKDIEYASGYVKNDKEKEKLEDLARDKFCSLINKDDIEWLDLTTREIRKRKLEEIEKDIENEST